MRRTFRLLFLFGLPAVAVLAGALGLAHALSRPTPADTEPPQTPAASPYAARVGGLGIVEPRGRVIDVGVNLPGVVRSVPVEPGDAVAAGDVLFQIDDEVEAKAVATAQAQAAVEQARVAAARAAVTAADADVATAEATLENAQQTLSRMTPAGDIDVVSGRDLDDARTAARVAESDVGQARARREQALAEVDAAGQRVAQAQAQADELRARLRRLTVRSPIDATVLAVDVRPGEYAPAGPSATPLMRLGDVSELHVRTSVDETLAARVHPDAPAVGFLRGLPDVPFPLTHLRREPLAVQKQNLTGGQTELVDTRVVEFVYKLDTTDPRLIVGSQMDVYIKAPPQP